MIIPTIDRVPIGESYYCFDLTTEEDLAEAIYTRKFGAPPDSIFRCNGLLWLGPIPESKEHRIDN